MKNYLYTLIIIGVTLTMDVLSKIFFVDYFATHSDVNYLDGFIRFTLVYNEGGVFGIGQGYKNVFLVISVIVLILMIGYYFYEKNKNLIFVTAMSFIMSGAIGNIIDRLIPGRRGVVDFLSIGVDGVYRWPAFNVADVLIIMGAILLVIVFYKEEKKLKAEDQK
jgi:signal peptidase II